MLWGESLLEEFINTWLELRFFNKHKQHVSNLSILSLSELSLLYQNLVTVLLN